MSDQVRNVPFVEEKLMDKIKEMNKSGNKEVVKTWSRSSTIYPNMVGHTIAVHDGQKHVPVFIFKITLFSNIHNCVYILKEGY